MLRTLTFQFVGWGKVVSAAPGRDATSRFAQRDIMFGDVRGSPQSILHTPNSFAKTTCAARYKKETLVCLQYQQ